MNKAKPVFWGMWDVYLFIFVIYIKLRAFNYFLNLPERDNTQLILGCIGPVLIMASLLSLFKTEYRKGIIFFLDLFVSLILVTDTVYNRYFYDVTSAALLKQARLAGEVGESIKALIHINDFFFFIDFILMIPLYKRLKKFPDKHESKLAVNAAIIIIMLLLGYTASRRSIGALNSEQPGILETFYDKKYVVSRTGDLNFHIYDFYRYIKNDVMKKEKIDESKKQEIMQWLLDKNRRRQNIYTGNMKGKNLIIVQLEAFQGFVLNRSINGQEITPNLNKLSKESLIFDDFYYETAGGGTSDAEFLSNVSLLPAREGSVFYLYSGNYFKSLVSDLKDKGYYTVVMHGNRPWFWNRSSMYRAIGFDRYFSVQDYKLNEIIGMGLGDKSFFRQSVEKMKEFRQPFYTMLISLSSHFPYSDSEKKLKDILDVGEFQGEFLGDYLKAVRYTDEAVGEFINELKREGLWDNSVVVFYGDHPAVNYDNRGQLAEFLYGRDDMSPLEWFNNRNVVMMMHFPNGCIKGHSKLTCGEMDIYPTLANLYGINSTYAFGRDILNSKDGLVVLREGTWADNDVVYIKDYDKVYNRKTGKELDKGSFQDKFSSVYKYLSYNDAILDYNLIEHFEKNKK